jgi:hypothetical protein
LVECTFGGSSVLKDVQDIHILKDFDTGEDKQGGKDISEARDPVIQTSI